MPRNVNLEELLEDEEPRGQPDTRASAKSSSKQSSKPKKGSQNAPGDGQQGSIHTKRHTLTLTPEQDRALKLARVDDDIDTTTRIRAMIELWEHDSRLRRRVDQLAKQRSAELVRHRPRRT